MRQRLQLAHCWRQAGKRGSSQISLQESNQGPWQLLQLKTLPLMLVPEINCGMPYLKYVKFNAAITELKLRVFYTCIKAKLPLNCHQSFSIVLWWNPCCQDLPTKKNKGKVNIQKISNLEIISD